MKGLIVLLTDFGLQDTYVGVMKGVIAEINRDLHIIDLTHQIPRHNVAAARFCLLDSYKYFPPNTVYLAVVDPGVGSRRRAIALAFERGYLVGPDNGIFSGILAESPATAAVELNNRQYWRSLDASSTFHGRDIFAPIAAHLASGVPLQALGTSIAVDSLVKLEEKPWEVEGDTIVGYIQYIDIYGNLISNIPGGVVEGKCWYVEILGQRVASGSTYSDTPDKALVALVGSHGWIEIAAHGDSAEAFLAAKWGNKLELKIISEKP